MKSGKYDRKVALLCPTCGGTQFEIGDDIEESVARVRCVSCDRELTKDELVRENSANVEEHVVEIGKEVTGDFAKEMKKRLKRAFRGSKHTKIK